MKVGQLQVYKVNTQNLHHCNINKKMIKNVTPDNVTPLDEGWTTTNLKKDWLQKCNVNKCEPFIVKV